MYRSRTVLAASLLAASFVVLAGGRVVAQDQLAAVDRTHLGRRPQDHVTLITGGGSSQTCPQGTLSTFRRGPDGQVPLPPEDFVVPAGKYLVLTDFAATFKEKFGNDWIAGDDIISVQLLISPPDQVADRVMWQTAVQIDGLMAASEKAWVSEHLTSGVVIGPGQRPCLHVGFGSTGMANTVTPLNASRMYGYLVDE